ncbi:MAG: hypothetical protein NTW79_01855 [Candidatus Berkelbacteria bacterium]|nr:hypothetical protein [Candidatus Berkelbacteria bacterium]
MKINFDDVIKKHPWIVENSHDCIISPDADGLICGLFMSKYFGWKIVGYYDNGKHLILKNGKKAKDCIFLDTEIFRKNIKSIGHHIVRYRQKDFPGDWSQFDNCFNPNNLRGRTLKEQFSKKYPMGTIHLLIALASEKVKIEFANDALFAVLQADGSINRLLDKYSENMADWLDYFRVVDSDGAFNNLLHHKIDLLDFCFKYVDYIQKFVKTKKDKILISDSNQKINSKSFEKNQSSFSPLCRKQIIEYLEFLSRKTGWKFNQSDWQFNNFKIYQFTKKSCKPGVRNYEQVIKDNALSMAFTSTFGLEYTIESPDRLP